MVVEAHGLFFSMQSIVIMCLIVATIVGNSFIIFVILWNKKLRIVQNYLTLSLSVTDLLVAVVVMTPSFIHNSTNLLQEGYLCKLWISLDVVCWSSSILHLVSIVVDRYWSLTRVTYRFGRPAKSVFIMIITS